MILACYLIWVGSRFCISWTGSGSCSTSHCAIWVFSSQCVPSTHAATASTGSPQARSRAACICNHDLVHLTSSDQNCGPMHAPCMTCHMLIRRICDARFRGWFMLLHSFIWCTGRLLCRNGKMTRHFQTMCCPVIASFALTGRHITLIDPDYEACIPPECTDWIQYTGSWQAHCSWAPCVKCVAGAPSLCTLHLAAATGEHLSSVIS